MDLEDAGSKAKYLIRDRDGRFPELFDTVLADAGIKVVLSGIQTPRMNSIMERWVRTCRHELLDRTLIWNQRHLLHALHEFEHFYNDHRPHQGLANARPLQPTAHTDRRPGPDSQAPRSTTRPNWRHPPRVQTCRLTCPDEIFGKHNRSYEPARCRRRRHRDTERAMQGRIGISRHDGRIISARMRRMTTSTSNDLCALMQQDSEPVTCVGHRVTRGRGAVSRCCRCRSRTPTPNSRSWSRG
jgi:hypothetical protein